MTEHMTTAQYRNVIAYVYYWSPILTGDTTKDILDMDIRDSLIQDTREDVIDELWSCGWVWNNDTKTLTYEDD